MRRLRSMVAAIALLTASWGASGEAGLQVELDFTQLYMWRGLDLLDGTPAFQPSLTWDRGDNWYLGAWGSFALDRGGGCREITGSTCWRWDEIDLYAGVYWSLAEGRRWQTDLDLSLTYFWFVHQDRDLDTAELGLTATFPRLIAEGGPAPYLKFFYNRGAQVAGDQGNWIIGGLEQELALFGQKLVLDLNVTWKDGDAGLWSYTGFSNANLSLALDYPIGGWHIVPTLNLQQALTGEQEGIAPEDKVWANILFSRAF